MAIAANSDWGLVALVEDGCVVVLVAETGSGPCQKQFTTDWVTHLQADRISEDEAYYEG